jgi:VIT1/CCC1 family predicted Fe2+/Mn2+ transporter
MKRAIRHEVLSDDVRKTILGFQRSEITEHHIYGRLSRSIKDSSNKKILKTISEDELGHYRFWKEHTKEDVKPDRLKVVKYFMISKILGLNFGVKLMENGEKQAQAVYDMISKAVPGARAIENDEDRHERELIGMIQEEKLKYVGSIVLGLNDALVELTGALAGFSFALQNAGTVALAGLITGVAAALSMGASEYLSTKSEGSSGKKSPGKASVYTTIAYMLTVLALVAPFLMLNNVFLSLGITIFITIAVIFFFTFYISVAKDLNFKRRFLEMAVISLGIAGVSFVIGAIIKVFLNISV